MSSPPLAAAAAAATTTTTTSILRPWPEFLSLSTCSFPISISESTDRVAQNLRYFSPNYTLIVLLIFTLSLLTHPISLVFFLVLFASWAYLYFLRIDPLEVFTFTVDDRLLLGFLGAVTVIGLFWARAWGSLVLAVAVGAVLIVVHAVIKAPEDDIHGSPYGELLSDLDGGRGAYVSV